MKILVLSHISELVGGAEKSLIEVFEILEKKYGVQPEFILRSPVGTLGSELKKRGWKYHEVDYTFWSESNPPKAQEAIDKARLKNTTAVVDIERIIKKTRPDIVMTNSVVCPWAALAAYYQGVPHVWFVREFGDLDHGRIFQIGQKNTWQDVGTLSELVITNSKALASHIKQYIPSEKITTLYHPFNLPEIIERSKEKVKTPFKQKESLKLILTAGSLTASKGVAEAVEAVGLLNTEVNNCEICLVGRQDNKDYLAKIQKIILRYNIDDKVHFVGWQKNPLAFVDLADVGIMSSRCEAFGRVTFEYITIGKPVLGTNSGGTPEMIQDNVNGYLYSWGNPKSLAEGLKNYASNKNVLQLHSKNASKKASELISSENNVDNLFAKIKMISTEQKELSTDKKINYESNLLNYDKAKKEISSRKSKQIRIKARTVLGKSYRLGRSKARKVIKGY